MGRHRRRDWTEILTRLPDEGEAVQVWLQDAPAPTRARLDRNDWVLADGSRVAVSMGDVWRPLPSLAKLRTLTGVRVLESVATR